MFRRRPPGGGQCEKQNVKPYPIWYQRITGFVLVHRTLIISIHLYYGMICVLARQHYKFGAYPEGSY